MSEPLRVTCLCGYENWVPAEKLGQTVPCFICGHDLVVGETPPAVPATNTPAGDSTPRLSGTPRSPFEADELETAVRPKFQYAPPVPAAVPPPAKRPRSPFEADGPEEEDAFRGDEKLVAGPFSLDAAPAPKQGPTVIDEMERHRPREGRGRHAVIQTISPHDAPTGEKCSQCGKEFRGSWDRVETAGGVLCYICSNQGTHGVPERLLKTESPRKREMHESEFLLEKPRTPEPVPYSPWWRDPHSDEFKNALAWVALGMVFLAFIVWMTGWGSPSPNAASNAQRAAKAAAVKIPGWVTIAVLAWKVVAGVLGTYLALYFTLAQGNRLPYDNFKMNAVYIGALLGLLIGVAAGLWVVAYLLKDIFIAGTIWFMIAGAMFILFQFWLLIQWLDFRLRDFAWMYIVFIPISQAVVWVLGMFVYWGLYALAT